MVCVWGDEVLSVLVAHMKPKSARKSASASSDMPKNKHTHTHTCSMERGSLRSTGIGILDKSRPMKFLRMPQMLILLFGLWFGCAAHHLVLVGVDGG